MLCEVIAVACAGRHRLSKPLTDEIRLLAGCGVEGDVHAGTTVKHRSRMRVDPGQPNLRQVHLIHGELIDELRDRDFDVSPGTMGENITTRGLALLDLPRGTRLGIGSQAVVEVTGLRNPCVQLERYQTGLMKAVLGAGANGELIFKCGVMGIVVRGGTVRPGDEIAVDLPPEPHLRLERV